MTSCQSIQKVYKKIMYTLRTPGCTSLYPLSFNSSMYTLCTPKKDESVTFVYYLGKLELKRDDTKKSRGEQQETN
jgi:hypothetical protein